MKLLNFKSFINQFPDRLHSFEIKRDNWKIGEHDNYLDATFNGKPTIHLNRQDLFEASLDLKDFVFKVLMWGYPTKGRGNNIENMLTENVLSDLKETLKGYRQKEISIQQLHSDTERIKGLGLSTMSKFTHFLNTTINGHRAVILDIQIIESIRNSDFEELKPLQNITYEKGLKFYPDYIELIDSLSKQLECSHDQLEMFLFTFGRNLRESAVRSFSDKMNSGKEY
jgi:hypothetical protein